MHEHIVIKTTIYCRAIVLAAGLCVSAGPTLCPAGETEPSAPVPKWTPVVQLRAQFLSKPRCPVYRRGEPVKVALEVSGARIFDDILEWHVADYLGKRCDRGTIKVPAGGKVWSGALSLKDYGVGYFELHLAFRKSRITLAPAGTRPGGFLAYGVEPDIEPLALAHPDDSRFGAQGTNFIETGRFVSGDSFSPVYPLIGAKWVYLDRRLPGLFAKGIDSFTPETDPERLKHSVRHEVKAGLVPMIDLHSVPLWLIETPDGAKLSNRATDNLQRYPPRDFDVYKQLVAQVVKEQVARRQAAFPDQAKNYYQIHWEPDWHYKGSDEGFIGMYKAAFEAVHENDPDGLLLGPNYGVIRTGNKHLRRLFAKGLAQYLDGILTHTYYVNPGPNSEKEMREDMRELVAMTREHLKPGAKILNTEWGVHWELPPSEDPNALRKEAGLFLRGHIMTLGEGIDTTFYFYTADHGSRGAGLFYNLTYPHPGCGAFHIAPKPVAMGVMTLSRLLEGSSSLGRIDYLGENILGYAFDRAGEKIVCLWSEDSDKQTVRVPCGNVETVTLVDPMGTPTALKPEAGIVSVTVSGIPVWLRGIGKEALPLRRAGDNPPFLSGFAGQTFTDISDTTAGENLRLFLDGAWKNIGAGNRLELPKNLSEGILALGVFTAEGTLRETRLVEVVPPLNMDIVTDSKPGSLLVELTNPQAGIVDGRLALLTEGSVFAEHPVSLQPGSSQRFSFNIRQFPNGKSPSVRFTTTDGAGSIRELPLFRTLLTAERTPQPPIIDGNLTDWRLELFQAGVQANKPELSEKLGVRMGFQYDDRNLYLAFKINDASHVQTKSPNGGWWEDSIQIGIGVTGDDSEQGWASWQKFTLMKHSVTGSQFCYRDMGNKLPHGLVDADTIRFVVNYTGDEAQYEIAIPWSQLDPDLSGPPTDTRLGIGVMVNDSNLDKKGAKTRRRCIDVTGGMVWSKPQDFGLLELRGARND